MAALTETVKESQLVADQKRMVDLGSHRNPLLSSLGTWGLCILFLLLLLVQAILLPSRVSLVSAVCLCDAVIPPWKEYSLSFHEARRGLFLLQGCRGGSHPGRLLFRTI